MNTFTQEERAMLVQSAQRWLSNEPVPSTDGDRWGHFADMGWLALALPETLGGLQADLSAICLMCEQVGRELAPEPYVAGAVLPGACLALEGAEIPDPWGQELATGGYRCVTSLFDLGRLPSTSAMASATLMAEGDWMLQGQTPLVVAAGLADAMLVTAELPVGGCGLFIVEAGAPGVIQENALLIDGSAAARWHLHQVACAAPVLRCEPGRERQMLAPAWRAGVLAHCAQTIGAMARALEITQDYVRQRIQFGKPIASYQTIQHRLVDLYVEIEEARALTWHAAATPVADASADPLSAAALALVSQAASHVWQEAIQMHGAIGMTDEYVIGRYVKHLAMASRQLGDHEVQLEQLAAICLDTLEENKDECTV
jgi:alkylation response protein AidB-like acyl-CoA dehydrogenase